MELDAIWRDYRVTLTAFLYANVKNPADVEDLRQEILIKVFNNLSEIKDTTKLKPWLFQIANNSIIDFYRKRAKNSAISEDDLWYDSSDTDSKTHKQLSQCIVPFIQAMDEEDTEMLMAIEIHGLSQKQYAEKSGIKYSTLKSRVQKSREKLQNLFSDCCEMSLDKQGNLVDFNSKTGNCNRC